MLPIIQNEKELIYVDPITINYDHILWQQLILNPVSFTNNLSKFYSKFTFGIQQQNVVHNNDYISLYKNIKQYKSDIIVFRASHFTVIHKLYLLAEAYLNQNLCQKFNLEKLFSAAPLGKTLFNNAQISRQEVQFYKLNKFPMQLPITAQKFIHIVRKSTFFYNENPLLCLYEIFYINLDRCCAK